MPDLEVGIAREDGGLLALDAGTGELRRSRPVGADGTFSFALVPVGDHELWIGTPADFAAGKPRHKQPLRVVRDGVLFIEVTLQ